MKHWPAILSEDETVDRLLAGASVARFGDGEIKLALGRPAVSQKSDPDLQRRLREILIDAGSCLVGLPNIHAATPKRAFWQPFDRPTVRALFRPKVYASAFVSRPDSAPWIARPDYWDKIRSLWRGKHVILVRGSGKSLSPGLLPEAAEVWEIGAPRQHAWSEAGRIFREVITIHDRVWSGRKPIVLLCLGATATVMAADLCSLGVQALDLGHLGMFLKREGQPPAAALEEGRREQS
jgi:hypothetical protein